MYRKLLGRPQSGGCVRPIEAWTELRTRTDRRTDWRGLAWAGGGCVGKVASPEPPSREGPRAERRTTHGGGDTREKRACSQHIYILCNIYIEGYTGLYTNLALSLLPCRVGAAVPGVGWSCRGTVTHPPEVRSGLHSFPLGSQVALQGWGGGLERGRQKPKGGSSPTRTRGARIP